MNIAVIGGGGREHAIIRSLKRSNDVSHIYALPGNGGIAEDAECVAIGAKDLDAIVDFAVEKKLDYVVVAPDDPLVLGLVDMLEEKGIPCFGPNKAAAIIEGSKAFSKQLMKKYGIPTAEYEIFSDMKAATLDLSRAVRYPAMMIFILSIGNAKAISLSAYDTSRISASPSLTNSIAINFQTPTQSFIEL